MTELKNNTGDNSEYSKILGTFFYISAILVFFCLIYYLSFYKTTGWWQHPTTNGKILLIGLAILIPIFITMGVIFHLDIKNIRKLSQWLSDGNRPVILGIILFAGFLFSLVVLLIPADTAQNPLHALHTRPVLLGLFALFTLLGILALVSFRNRNVRIIWLLIDGFNKDTINSIRNIRLGNVDWLKQVRKNWVHILIWLVMISYFILGPSLYAKYVLRNGKTISFTQPLPAVTTDIKFNVDNFQLVTFDGQDVYHLLGWSFYTQDPDQQAYDRYIVLQSDSRTYFFSTEIFKRPTVQEAFKDLHLDLLYSGYTTLISKDVIRPGAYRVGIVFDHKTDNSIYYYITKYTITRSANYLFLSDQ